MKNYVVGFNVLPPTLQSKDYIYTLQSGCGPPDREKKITQILWTARRLSEKANT